MAGARIYQFGTIGDPFYLFLITMEETLEMAGALLFFYAVLDYLQRNAGELAVGITR